MTVSVVSENPNINEDKCNIENFPKSYFGQKKVSYVDFMSCHLKVGLMQRVLQSWFG